MKLSVKKGYNLQVILDKLKETSEINEDGSLTFIGFESDELTRLLSQIICFPKFVKHINVDSLTTLAFKNCLVSNNITEKKFLEEAGEELKIILATPEETFYVLTSININTDSLNIKVWEYLDCVIEFVGRKYHSKFTDRDTVINSIVSDLSKEATPLDYTKVQVKVKSRSMNEAIRRGIDALNFYRALSCIEMNSVGMILGGAFQPINKIRLGKIHTLHDGEGKAFSHPISFEPKFEIARMQKPSKPEIFQKNIEYYFSRIEVSKFSADLENALLRYVDALDESDHDVAVTKLWGALESLVVKDKDNCELMPSRISARYGNSELKKQMIMHIREYRNALIHKGVGDENSIHRAYHLQLIFSDLLRFYISDYHSFSSLTEANRFLDKASIGEDKLKSEIAAMKKALNFLGIDKDD